MSQLAPWECSTLLKGTFALLQANFQIPDKNQKLPAKLPTVWALVFSIDTSQA